MNAAVLGVTAPLYFRFTSLKPLRRRSQDGQQEEASTPGIFNSMRDTFWRDQYVAGSHWQFSIRQQEHAGA